MAVEIDNGKVVLVRRQEVNSDKEAKGGARTKRAVGLKVCWAAQYLRQESLPSLAIPSGVGWRERTRDSILHPKLNVQHSTVAQQDRIDSINCTSTVQVQYSQDGRLSDATRFKNPK